MPRSTHWTVEALENLKSCLAALSSESPDKRQVIISHQGLARSVARPYWDKYDNTVTYRAIEKGLTILGFIGVIDQPKPSSGLRLIRQFDPDCQITVEAIRRYRRQE